MCFWDRGRREKEGENPTVCFCLYEMSSFNKVITPMSPCCYCVRLSNMFETSLSHVTFWSFLIKEQTYPTNPEVLIVKRQCISAYVPFHYQLVVFGQQLHMCRGPTIEQCLLGIVLCSHLDQLLLQPRRRGGHKCKSGTLKFWIEMGLRWWPWPMVRLPTKLF